MTMTRQVGLAALFVLALVAGNSWAQGGLRAAFGPGELSAGHLDEDGAELACEQCHEAGAFVDDGRCLLCHEDIADLRLRADSFHAGHTEPCSSCHAEHRGRDADLIQFDPQSFVHTDAGFALEGGHDAACEDCHAADTWLGAGRRCDDCHKTPHGSRFLRLGPMGDCASCHTITDWDVAELPASFDHANSSRVRYPLDGAHTDVACLDCHPKSVFAPTPFARCSTCHDDPHRLAKGECDDCHDTDRWEAPSASHANLGFALRGLHTSAPCTSCHGEDLFAPLRHQRCGQCHEDPHEGSFAPRDCEACHDAHPVAWALRDFDHSSFELAGRHADVPCRKCHGEGETQVWTGLATDQCSDCHRDEHEGRFTPDDCAACHTVDGFAPATIAFRPQHARTGFALIGLHSDTACEGCHVAGEQINDASSCVLCHEDDHGGAFRASECGDCHAAERTWRKVEFAHEATGFALMDGHAEARCRDCHRSEAFDDAEPTCRSCHAGDTPKHHFPQECDQCHGPAEWADATLDADAHAALGFPLAGAHLRATCADCHPAGADAAPDCISCHGADDAHTNQLGDDCAACHRENDWLRSTFRHTQVGWPLRGPHALAECDDCHGAGFVGTPRDCETCHADVTAWP
ncbi:MAG: hypothetical protein KDA24_26065 [Deltaproteobacteria bacterium]|nr:hypothetical protein [Deltaproteobacteria bacterium]